jgi:hypothetical protein
VAFLFFNSSLNNSIIEDFEPKKDYLPAKTLRIFKDESQHLKNSYNQFSH